MLRRDFEQSRVTTQTRISANSASSPSLELDTTNDGVEYCAGTVPAGTEFPDLPIENVSPESTLPYSDVRGVEVEDGNDLQDMEESDKGENGILCTISRNTNVERSQETSPVLADTTRPADGDGPAPVLKILPDLHVERTVGEKGAGDGGDDDIGEFHTGHLSQRAGNALCSFKQRDRGEHARASGCPAELTSHGDNYEICSRRLEQENVSASRILSASGEIETGNLAAVPASPEIPTEANDGTYRPTLGAMSFHEAPSADIIVSSVENVEFDSCSLAHGQVSNMMSHVDFTAVGAGQQEACLAYPNQAEQTYSKGDLSWISCSICCVNRWKLVFVPCGHASCNSCYKRLTKCHICRSHIDRVVKPLLAH